MTALATQLSIRTQVRTDIIAALVHNTHSERCRNKDYEVLTDFIDETQQRKSVSYCVVVTDEQIEVHSQGSADVTLTVLIVIWVSSSLDPRAMLDASIEDVWEALRVGYRVNDSVPYLSIDGIETNEGAASAKPNANAVIRMNVKVRRDVSW